MKTATVTWITYHNYGTELQAYALQKYLQSLGYENRILDDRLILAEQYRKNRVQQTADLSTTGRKTGRKRRDPLSAFLIRAFHYVRNRIEARKTAPYVMSQEQIAHFKQEQLTIDHRLDPRRLDLTAQEYDVFFCGSDQIWSPLDVNFNGYYYLDFPAKKKIAYAPSFGMDTIPAEKADIIRGWLSDFSAISVREKQNADQLVQITGREVSWVCDPTLLHDGRFWSAFCAKSEKKRHPYLLCYFLEDKDWYYRYARQTAKRLHLQPILIPCRKSQTNRRLCLREGVGPTEFVSLFEHASYVLTDSYHGSIFSLLFSKQFLYLKRFEDDAPNNQNSRVFSLFQMLDLEKIIVLPDARLSADSMCIDYEAVQERLERFRQSSQVYLQRSLGG